MKKAKLLLLLISIILVTSCAVKFIADYDRDTAYKIVEISKMVDLFYLNIAETDSLDRNYDKFAEYYKIIEVEIRALIMVNKMKPKNEDSTKNAENLLTNWIEIKDEHKQSNSYDIDVAEIDAEIVQDQLLELAKKEISKQ